MVWLVMMMMMMMSSLMLIVMKKLLSDLLHAYVNGNCFSLLSVAGSLASTL